MLPCVAADGVRLPVTTAFGSELPLVPMLRYMDNVALVSVRYLQDSVFVPGSGVRRGTFIEDTFGKQTQMQARARRVCTTLIRRCRRAPLPSDPLTCRVGARRRG